jgi:hypothetical protein
MVQSDHMQSISAANRQEAVRKNDNGVWPCSALKKYVIAEHGQFLAIRHVFSATALHVMGSYYDPIPRKVVASQTGEKTFGKRKRGMIWPVQIVPLFQPFIVRTFCTGTYKEYFFKISYSDRRLDDEDGQFV